MHLRASLSLLLIALCSSNVCSRSKDIKEIIDKGDVFLKSGNLKEAKVCFEHATLVAPQIHVGWLKLGDIYREQMNDPKSAIAPFRSAKKLRPDLPIISLLLATCFSRLGKLSSAKREYEDVLKLDPKNAAALVNLGSLLNSEGKLKKSADLFQRAIEMHPNLPEAHYNFGDVLYKQGKYDPALEKAEKSLSLNPGLINAYLLIANVAEKRQEWMKGVEACRRAIAVNPATFSSYYTLGRFQKNLGELQNAAKSFRTSLRFSNEDGSHKHQYAYNELGHVMVELGDDAAALEAYQSAVTIDPKFAEALVNVGFKSEGFEESKNAYESALKVKPNLTNAWINLGITYYSNYNLDPVLHIQKALECYEKALEVEPTSTSAFYSLVRVNFDLCNWKNFAERYRKLEETVRSDLADNSLKDTSFSFVHALVYPLPVKLTLELFRYKSELVLARSKEVRETYVHPDISETDTGRRSRLRVGYISPDFRNHPVSHLFQSVPGLHNQTRTEVTLWSLRSKSSAHGSSVWNSLNKANHWHDISALSVKDAAAQIYEAPTDILVDLAVFTQHSRPEILALQPAAVQISMLGFTSTTGASWLQYLLTDRIASPPDFSGEYSEKLLYMPYASYVTDHSQSRSELLLPNALPAVAKEQIGVPRSTRVLYACFNQAFKIRPDLFAVWMEILKAVPGSVLWIVKLNEGAAAEGNLIREAAAKGVSEAQLFFTGTASLEDHVAIKSGADLFLDTTQYNGHSTTVDTLFAGTPVITLPADRMASRVASSLVQGVGCPELVVRSLEEYQELAIALGNHPHRLKAVKKKLRDARHTTALFDTVAWVRNWETILRAVWDMRIASGGCRGVAHFIAARPKKVTTEKDETEAEKYEDNEDDVLIDFSTAPPSTNVSSVNSDLPSAQDLLQPPLKVETSPDRTREEILVNTSSSTSKFNAPKVVIPAEPDSLPDTQNSSSRNDFAKTRENQELDVKASRPAVNKKRKKKTTKLKIEDNLDETSHRYSSFAAAAYENKQKKQR